MMRLMLVGLCLAVVTPAFGAAIAEVEPDDSLAAAQSLDGSFTLDFSPDIGDVNGTNTSTLYPHVSILGTGDGQTYDYFRFTVPVAGVLGIFDIDYGTTGGSVDTEIAVWDASGAVVGSNDDSVPTHGAGGSVSSFDSFLQLTFAAPGVYTVGVADWPATPMTGGWVPGSDIPRAGSDYVLQVSLSQVVPEPGSLVLFALGALGMAVGICRRRARA